MNNVSQSQQRIPNQGVTNSRSLEVIDRNLYKVQSHANKNYAINMKNRNAN